jgi:hypothetical protein
MMAQTVWLPMSSRLVLQQPSRKNPVLGFIEQSSRRSPRTFLGACGRPPPFPVSSLSTADLWIAATFPIPATAGRRQWAPALVLGVEESTQALVAAARISNGRL